MGIWYAFAQYRECIKSMHGSSEVLNCVFFRVQILWWPKCQMVELGLNCQIGRTHEVFLDVANRTFKSI